MLKVLIPGYGKNELTPYDFVHAPIEKHLSRYVSIVEE